MSKRYLRGKRSTEDFGNVTLVTIYESTLRAQSYTVLLYETENLT